MRTTTTKRLAAILGVTVALALSGIPQLAGAQTAAQTADTQNGSARHSTRMKHEPSARAAHARAAPPQQQQQQQPGSNGSDANGLPGYSARPQGMCWTPGGGGGQDLSGSWGACQKR